MLLGEGTVKNDVSWIMEKLHARTRTALAVRALRDKRCWLQTCCRLLRGAARDAATGGLRRKRATPGTPRVAAQASRAPATSSFLVLRPDVLQVRLHLLGGDVVVVNGSRLAGVVVPDQDLPAGCSLFAGGDFIWAAWCGSTGRSSRILPSARLT